MDCRGALEGGWRVVRPAGPERLMRGWIDGFLTVAGTGMAERAFPNGSVVGCIVERLRGSAMLLTSWWL
jgi:hypothetical protein